MKKGPYADKKAMQERAGLERSAAGEQSFSPAPAEPIEGLFARLAVPEVAPLKTEFDRSPGQQQQKPSEQNVQINKEQEEQQRQRRRRGPRL